MQIDYKYWTVMPKVFNHPNPLVYGSNKEKGLPVNYSDKITLMNNGTKQKLYSHNGI
ncbi:37418_t:CDS:2 [Gigaspora margarita]|uniref:37418_t:CDS:1 n=1 Tax=Gigaspora margarita TaxID=4874 RepID=A0ABM8W036_GIGMA|nr:37418_t:CDS:2 [Gigaspora margarita]